MTSPTLHASQKTKKTAIGEIPVDWCTRELGKVCKILSGGTPHKAQANYWNGSIPWFSAKDLKKLRLTDSIDTISTEGAAANCRLVPGNTVLILVRGMTLNKDVPVGITTRESAFNQDLKALLPNDGISSEFLAYALIARKKHLLALVDRSGHGTGRLPTELLESFVIALPPLPEQGRIATLLGAWDRAIDRQEQLLTAKLQFKRGLMQQLLTSKLQFPESNRSRWTRMKIGQFTRPAQRAVKKPDEPFKALGIRSHGKGTFLKTDFDPAAIEMTELFEVKKDDLIVNITFAWEGAIAIVGDAGDGALVSHRFPTYIFDKDLVLPEYFRYVIVQRSFVTKLGLISPGGAGRNRVLSKRDFAKIEVLVPPIPEQKRIAAVLNSCDWEIELLQDELTAFKDQKGGLMQKLLTGDVRIRA